MQPALENVFPEDDEVVLVSNEKIHPKPVLAYFNEEHKCFFPHHGVCEFPLFVTHWMRIPKFGFES